jgi:hypothetical protein
VGTGVSLFFMAVGAILTFAVETNADGFDLDAAGVILMLLGVVGLLWSLIIWDEWRPPRRRRFDDVVDEEVPVRRTVRRVYH